MNVGGGYLWIAFEDELSLFECAGGVPVVARNASGFDEGGDRIGEIGQDADEALGLEVGGKFRPALEAVFAREDQLGIGESETGGGDLVEGEFVEDGMVALDAVNRVGFGCAMGV